MPNQLIYTYNLYNKSNSNTEFDKFFDSKTADNQTVWSIKKKILDTTDIFYFNLPRIKDALALKAQLTLNDGIVFEEEKDETPTNQKLLEEFQDSFPHSKSLEFLTDLIRIRETKGNVLIIYSIKSQRWEIIEPHRFKVITNSANSLNAKYNIIGFKVKNYGKEETFLLKENPNIIFWRSSPSSVFGVPPLMIGEQTSLAICAEIKRQYLISNSGAFSKKVLMLKENQNLSEEDSLRLANDLNITLQDPTKAVTVTNYSFDTAELKQIDSNSTFWTDISDGYIHHTASLTGIGASMLVSPKTINRATKEQEYKEMIQYSIQPLNREVTKLVQRMFEIWSTLTNQALNFQITIQNPRSALDVAVSTSELLNLEKEKIITTNELRRMLGLEEYSDEQLLERDKNRGISNQTNSTAQSVQSKGN
jgi:hypothetical protein